MLAPTIPLHEAERLQRLRALKVLDTPPEERFDRLTRLASQIFDVPIALVSLIDADRQWFKSRQGLDAPQTGRDISFCGHAILQPDPFLINDTLEDARFRDNPLVLGAPFIRFYAGQPLCSQDGMALGTFCLIDSRPRRLDPGQIQSLKDLAAMVEQELLYQDLGRIQEERDRFFSLSLDLLAILDSQGRFKQVSEAFESSLGWPGGELLGEALEGFIHPGDRWCLPRLLEGSGAEALELRFQRRDGGWRWLSWRSQTGGGAIYASARDITEQHAAFERFRAIFEQSSDAHLLFDGSGILDCNLAAVTMLGCADKAEVLSLHPSQLSPEFQPDGSRSDAPSTWREEQARSQGCCRFEWLHRSKAGHEFLTEVSLTPVMLEGRQIFMEVWHDLTERRRTEGLKTRLIEILESTPDFVGMATADRQVVYWNRAFRTLKGLSEGEDISGLALPTGHSPRSAEHIRDIALPTADREGIWVGESEFLDAEGRPVPAWQTILAHRDSAGKTTHFSTVARDLRALRMAETALRESEARFRSLAASAPVGVFETDARGNCTYLNQQATRILGMSFEAAQGLGWVSMIHPEDQSRVAEGWREALAEHREFGVEYRIPRPSGALTWAFAKAAPILDGAGRPKGYVGILLDITIPGRPWRPWGRARPATVPSSKPCRMSSSCRAGTAPTGKPG